MATASAAVGVNTSFIADCVKSINAFRSIHQVAPLTHNVELSTVAQKWAEHLAAYDTFGHNPDAKHRGERLGENCAMKWTSDKQDFTGTQVADQWYSEVQRYDFKKNSGPSTGHFTQLVWKASREIGVGRSQTREGKWLVVANFFPAGNLIGRNAENVLPPRDGKIPPLHGGSSPPFRRSPIPRVPHPRVLHSEKVKNGLETFRKCPNKFGKCRTKSGENGQQKFIKVRKVHLKTWKSCKISEIKNDVIPEKNMMNKFEMRISW